MEGRISLGRGGEGGGATLLRGWGNSVKGWEEEGGSPSVSPYVSTLQ